MHKGFASGGSNVPVRHFFVNLSFVARSEFSAENPARTQSPETLYNTPERHCIFKHIWFFNRTNPTLKTKRA